MAHTGNLPASWMLEDARSRSASVTITLVILTFSEIGEHCRGSCGASCIRGRLLHLLISKEGLSLGSGSILGIASIHSPFPTPLRDKGSGLQAGHQAGSLRTSVLSWQGEPCLWIFINNMSMCRCTKPNVCWELVFAYGYSQVPVTES